MGAGLPTIAVSHVGEGEPKLSLPADSKPELHDQAPPGAPLSAPASAPKAAPPSLVAVVPRDKPNALATNPFNDGTPRVPISLLYECTSPTGQRAAGGIHNGYGKQPMS